MADGQAVLVRSGLRLEECITETCCAGNVLKRFASQTLKLVSWISQVCNAFLTFSETVQLTHFSASAVPVPSSLRAHSSLQARAPFR
jgi:hypothetical protein